MKLINITAVYQAANSKITAAAAALGAQRTDASAQAQATAALAAERLTESLKANAAVILDVKANMQEFLVQLATTNVALQNQLDGNAALAADIVRAMAYGDETDNYLPVNKLMGVQMPRDVEKALTEVPKIWAPATAAAASAAA
jgi:hypothetical protein